ncbi:MAG: anthranilate phosphoribosyltransferase [Polyangiaceae bacterium]
MSALNPLSSRDRRDPIDARAILERLLRGEGLSRAQAAALAREILTGEVPAPVTAAILAALRAKGESAAEIAGFVDVFAAAATPIELDGPLLDTCGTGGDGAGTFNVSTVAAIVAAALGARVAKHGNGAISSRSGSSDLLAALGAKVDLEPASVARSVRTTGLGFLYAPRFHPAFRAVADVRRALGVRTIFNLLGPLLNPAPITHQLLGVMAPELVLPIAAVLREKGRRRALVVHGDGLDEIATSGPTTAVELRGAALDRMTLTPEALGVPRADKALLRGGSAEENARATRAVLGGASGPLSDAVAASAGVAVFVAGLVETPREGVARAREAMGDGRAARKLEAFIDVTRSEP